MPTPDEKQLYFDATQEVDNGTPDHALWAKAMAFVEGDKEKAKYRHSALRVEELSKASAPPLRSATVMRGHGHTTDSGDDA